MPMRTGAVAFLDALGFKGIWHEENPWTAEDVVRKLQHAMRRAREAHAQDNRRLAAMGYPLVSFHFLSDTVVVVAENSSPTRSPGEVVDWLCAHVASFTEEMLIGEMSPPLAYRGAVTYGEFIVEDPFILGRAVDEAGEAERRAEGAFVWLCPSALDVFAKQRGGIGTIPWTVPMKDGPAFETAVVPPLWVGSSWDVVESALSKAFLRPNAPLTARTKHQNTVPMIREARLAWKKDEIDGVH